MLVAARTAAGVSLFAVAGDSAGLVRKPLATLDPTRKQARLDLDGVHATLVGAEGDGDRVLPAVLDLAAVALAAEQVGGAQRCLDMAVAYAKERVQFGRPIGSFQAIKHKCADVLLEVESARSAAYYAGVVRRGGQRGASGGGRAREGLLLGRVRRTPPRRTSRSTAASASRGSTPRTCTSGAPSPRRLLFGDASYHRERVARHCGI